MNHASALGLLAVALAVVVTAGPWGCSCGSDATRAAAERTQIRSTVDRSLALVPYRTLKVVSRAAGAAQRPPELQKVLERLPGPDALPPPEDTRSSADTSVEVAALLYESRVELARLDEDHYPLLWATWVQRPPPVAWYGAEAEHLALATAWTLGQLIDLGGRTPVMDFSFYELSRAEPKGIWPLPQLLWARLVRGVAYAAGGFRYAGEEELSAYLALVDACTPAQARGLQLAATDLPVIELARAAGHFARGLNRLGLLRQAPAVDDIEAGVAALGRAGVDNEATWWGAAFVSYARGKHADTARSLERLAASPFLDEPTRQEIAGAAKDLKKQRPGVFGPAQGATVLGAALVARAGGGERILASLVGEQSARSAADPLVWLARMRDGVSRYPTPDAIAGALREKARRTAELRQVPVPPTDAPKAPSPNPERPATP